MKVTDAGKFTFSAECEMPPEMLSILERDPLAPIKLTVTGPINCGKLAERIRELRDDPPYPGHCGGEFTGWDEACEAILAILEGKR